MEALDGAQGDQVGASDRPEEAYLVPESELSDQLDDVVVLEEVLLDWLAVDEGTVGAAQVL